MSLRYLFCLHQNDSPPDAFMKTAGGLSSDVIDDY